MRKSIVHCVKSVRIRKFSGPYFPSCRLNKEIQRVDLRIQFKSLENKDKKNSKERHFSRSDRIT